MIREWRIGQNRRVLHVLCFSFSNYHERSLSLIIINLKITTNNDGIFERVKSVAGKVNYNVVFSFLVEIFHKSFRNYKSR